MNKKILPLMFLACGLFACNEHSLKSVEIESNLIPEEPFVMDLDKRLDILFVIDNSGSMAPFQANLARNFGGLATELENSNVDYRVGLLTTDMGGWGSNCKSTGASLRLSSCLDREPEFTFPGDPPRFEEACKIVCEFNNLDLGLENEQWLESINGIKNYSRSLEEVLSCVGPQGIDGCGFESPLESVYQFLDKDTEFLRPNALLAIIVLTDEADCSFNPQWKDELFSPQGDRIFWQDPSASSPNSAVCWNAGVSCLQDMNGDFDCVPEDWNSQRQRTEVFSEAVLYPYERYLDLFLNTSGKLKSRKILFSLIGGVQEDGTVHYTKQDDMSVSLFGIDPGCFNGEGSEIISAIPPVRMKEVSLSLGSPLYSVCAEEYNQTVVEITNTLLSELPPACYTACVQDMDPASEELDYSCQVAQVIFNEGEETMRTPIYECENEVLSENENACWIALTGEDRDIRCQENENQNLQMELLRRPGIEVPWNAEIKVSCESSVNPQVDCG